MGWQWASKKQATLRGSPGHQAQVFALRLGGPFSDYGRRWQLGSVDLQDATNTPAMLGRLRSWKEDGD